MSDTLTPDELAELRRLLEEYRVAPGGYDAVHEAIRRWYRLSNALVNAAPRLLAMAGRAVREAVPFVCERCSATYYEHRGGEYLCPTCSKEDVTR